MTDATDWQARAADHVAAMGGDVDALARLRDVAAGALPDDDGLLWCGCTADRDLGGDRCPIHGGSDDAPKRAEAVPAGPVATCRTHGRRRYTWDTEQYAWVCPVQPCEAFVSGLLDAVVRVPLPPRREEADRA